MPIIKTPTLPEAIDPKQGSVFDPLYQTLLRKAVSLAGLDDPTSTMMQAAAPTPLVSIYKNAAERAVGTNAFKEAANRISGAIGSAGESFAEKYPRIAAHMSLFEKEFPNAPGRLAAARSFGGQVTEPIPTAFTKLGKALGEVAPDRIKNTMFHEGTHAAQMLGNSDIDQLYRLANKLAGYQGNPIEITARAAGQKAIGEVPMMASDLPTGKYTAGRGLEQLTKPASTLEGPKVTEARNLLQKILLRRGMMKEAVPEAQPTAKFLGWQNDYSGGGFPLYNVEGGPLHGSSVSAETLTKQGIQIPHTPPMPKWDPEAQ